MKNVTIHNLKYFGGNKHPDSLFDIIFERFKIEGREGKTEKMDFLNLVLCMDLVAGIKHEVKLALLFDLCCDND